MLKIVETAMFLTLILGTAPPSHSQVNRGPQTYASGLTAHLGGKAVGQALHFREVNEVAQTVAKPGQDFTIDVANSTVEFFVGSTAGDVNGTFSAWKGQLNESTAGIPESATLSLEISASSMTTRSGAKDRIVKGKDFFYVQEYPSILFTSKSVIISSDPNKFRVHGDLTLRGVTKSVELQVTLDRDGKGGGQIYADLSFDRRDFGMTRNVPFVRVGDSIRVRLDLHVVIKDVARAKL